MSIDFSLNSGMGGSDGEGNTGIIYGAVAPRNQVDFHENDIIGLCYHSQ